MTIPTYLPYFVFAGTAATLIAILYGLNRAFADAAWPASERTRAFRVSAILLLGWLAATIALAARGVYHVEATAIPTIQYGIALPIVVGVLLIWRSKTARRILDAVPQPWLVGIQLYRALGVIFLILYANGKLPAFFAWPAGVGDIAIGLLAPVVGFAYAQAPRDTAGLVRAWNVFGILDLVGCHNRLHDRAIVAPAYRGPTDQRPDDSSADGVDSRLSGAIVDHAAYRLVGEAAPQ